MQKIELAPRCCCRGLNRGAPSLRNTGSNDRVNQLMVNQMKAAGMQRTAAAGSFEQQHVVQHIEARPGFAFVQ